MPHHTKRTKLSPTRIKEHIKRIQEATEEHERKNKGGHFTSISLVDIKKKLRSGASPIIVSQSWGPMTPKRTLSYRLEIYNPTPTETVFLFVHVWVGSGNVDANIGTFLTNIDLRFPRLTKPEFPGLKVAPGEFADLEFIMQVPASVESTSYLGNSCLMQIELFDVGRYLDRAVFPFAVQ